MRKQLVYLTIFVVLAVVSFNRCYYDNRDDLYPLPVDTIVTFSDDIEPLITGTCADGAGCHGSGSNYPVLETYEQIKNHIDRIEVRAVKDKSMPPAGPLSEEQLNKLTTWIADGAPKN